MTRRLLAAWLLLCGTLWLAAAPAPAQTSSTTTSTVIVETAVTVEGGPAREATFRPPCNDVILAGIEERLSFVLRRSGPTTAPLTVTYGLSGTAQADVHYDPLPGSATFPAGAAAVTVPVVPRQTTRGALVELTLTVTGGTPLAPPVPPAATIRFVSPPSPGPHECGYRFTDDSWNDTQTIAAGAAPRPLTLEEFSPPVLAPATGVFRLKSGGLPPGVELRRDGSFGGAASAAGTFTAVIEACRPEPPNTCVTTTLTVTVTAGLVPRDPLPRTGATNATGDLVTTAAALFAGGLIVLALAAPVRPRRNG